MKRLSSIHVFTVILIVLSATVVLAARRGGGGWGMGGAFQRLYNPATVETVTGDVLKVERMAPMRGMSAGVHLLLKTEKETIPVHLGPEWFIGKLNTGIKKGDELQVTGSRVTFEGKPAIIASEVKKGEFKLELRDSAGIPVWSGWRRK